VRPKGGKYGEDIYVSTHVDDCLICCKSTATMSKFKCLSSAKLRSTDSVNPRAGGSRSQTHRRAAKGGFTQDDGYVQGVAPDAHDPLLLRILLACTSS
jgi:hypothetical protein